MRVLSISTLFPHDGAPHHGIFVENRLAAMAERGHDVRVIAPVPWFPSANARFGAYAVHARAERYADRRGMKSWRPRYVLAPKLGMTMAPASLRLAIRGALAAATSDGWQPELIDAHYLYPDAIAAGVVADDLGLPLVATARGTDVTSIPDHAAQRRAILAVCAQAERIVCVADALRDDLVGMGAAPDVVTTIRNGVDLRMFSPGDRGAARRALRVDGPAPVIASVGHLIERKGHALVIEALDRLPAARLLIAGTGPEEQALRALAGARGVGDRVRFLGAVPHEALAEVYRAADVLALASSREGWPNVLLEAMACGTPCVAAPAGGSGEVVNARAAGLMAEDRSADAIADAIRTIFADPPAREATRAHAAGYGWGPVAAKVEDVWLQAVRTPRWGRAVRRHSAAERPRVILTVDTEECFDWSGEKPGHRIAEPERLIAIQRVAERNGVRPLYFCAYPVLQDDGLGGTLAELVAAGRADAGLHLHGWVTPPTVAGQGCTGPESYQHNLEHEAHADKLDTLIAAFEARFGMAPAAHRAGRYGAAPWVLDQLADRGVLADFSPSAAFDMTADGGPDYTRFDGRMRRRGEQLVLPVSGARRWRKGPFGAPPPGLGSIGRIAAIKASGAVRLSPEGVSQSAMERLAIHLEAQGAGILTPTLHSSSVVPGTTPYAASETDVASLLDRLDGFLRWARARGCKPISLAEIEAIRTGTPTV